MNQKEIKRISHAPERIWLQIGEDDYGDVDEGDTADVDWKEVSWCRDKIFNTDIEYVRIDHCKGAKPSE